MNQNILNKKLKENELKTDEFGRLVIDDPELMNYVAGSAGFITHFGTDKACGSNAGCGNAGCRNIKC